MTTVTQQLANQWITVNPNGETSVKVLQQYLLALGMKLPEFGDDGLKGKETYNAIDALEFPLFVKIALREVGTKEIKGAQHNPRVLEYQRETMGKYTDDETPWCGSFISWTFRKARIDHGIRIPERAKEWINFGVATTEPKVGTLAIKSRTGGGHVCIVLGKDTSGNLLCLGGNQSDEVNIAKYPPSVFESFRDYKVVGPALRVINLSAKSSVSEA